jgi:hypothetical protein
MAFPLSRLLRSGVEPMPVGKNADPVGKHGDGSLIPAD